MSVPTRNDQEGGGRREERAGRGPADVIQRGPVHLPTPHQQIHETPRFNGFPFPPSKMDNLPDELLLHIISYLDHGPPSTPHFFDEPDPLTLTSFRDQPLKELSLVSPRWRRIVKPLLFQYLRFTLHILDDARNEWSPDSAPELFQIRRFLASFGPRRRVHGLAIRALGEIYGSLTSDVSTVSNCFWSDIFHHIEPTCIRLVAPPAALARLAGCNGDWQHSWAFDQTYHILELRQDPNARYDNLQNPVATVDGLMARRNWCHLGYNEGSSLPAYNLYEYQHYVSPCLLQHLLEQATWDTNTATSLTYVAIFPTSGNLLRLARHLALTPNRCRMTFQLAPEPTSTILHEPDRMKRAQPADLWVELDRGYELLTGCVLHGQRHSERGSVKSRDYRWKALVETLDDDEHLGALRYHGWTKADDDEWVSGDQEHMPVPMGQ